MRRHFQRLIPLLAMPLLAGCDKKLIEVPPSIWQPTGHAASIEPEVDSIEPATPTLPPYRVMRDDQGNCLKAIVRSSQTTLNDLDNRSIIRALRLMDKAYVHYTQENDLAVGSNPRGTAEGFVRAGDVIVTPTMEFAAFDATRANLRLPIEGFATFDDAVKRLHGEPITPSWRERPLPIGTVDVSWMPILQSRDIELADGQTCQLLEVASWTWNPRDGVAALTTVATDAHENLSHLSAVDCVLVVDGTASMEPVWQAMQSFLNSTLQSLKQSDLKVNFAIVAYRDNDRDSLWSERHTDLTSDLPTISTWLQGIKPEGGGDWEEAMFPAIQTALDLLKQQGRPGAYQSIVVVADNGGHVSGVDGVLGDVGQQVVAEAAGRGVVISAVQCPYHATFNGDEKLLPRQLKKITSQTQGFILTMANATAEQAAEKLTASCRKTHQGAILENKVVVDLQQGRTHEDISRDYGLPRVALESMIDHATKRLGTDPTRLTTSVGTIGVERVWLIYDPTAIRTGVLIRDDELKTLLATLDQIVQRGVEHPEALVELWTTMLGSTVGETDVPLAEALRVQGIPVRKGLLSITLAELSALPRAARQEWANEVERKFERLVKESEKAAVDANGIRIVASDALP